MNPFRYLFKQLLRNFIGCYLIFCCVFMINFIAMHMEMAEKNRFLILELIEHVLRITLAHTYILAPLALLMSSCLTYTLLQIRMEIVAFLSQGISRLNLLKPLIYISFSLILFEGSFYLFYDATNEDKIENGSVVGSYKTNFHPVQVLDLMHNQKVLYSLEGKKDAYFYSQNNTLYFTEDFDPHRKVFIAQKILEKNTSSLRWKNLEKPIAIKLSIKPKILHDISKPFQIFLIALIPFLISWQAFKFSRNSRPLMILGRTSIIYLGSHILGKSLCHILSRLI